MATDPVQVVEYTRDALNRKFVQEKWQQRLPEWAPVETSSERWHQPNGEYVRVVGTKYKDADGNTRAWLFVLWREQKEGNTAAQALRDDADILHKVAA